MIHHLEMKSNLVSHPSFFTFFVSPSSALWPFSTLGWPDVTSEDFKKFYPTTMLETGYVLFSLAPKSCYSDLFIYSLTFISCCCLVNWCGRDPYLKHLTVLIPLTYQGWICKTWPVFGLEHVGLQCHRLFVLIKFWVNFTFDFHIYDGPLSPNY